MNLAVFLRTDPHDVGCDAAMRLLHVCAEDPAGAERQYPGVAAHLRACGPCATDFEGLLAVLTDRLRTPPTA